MSEVTLRGVILEKQGGFKDSEAWNAGSSPYYVLDVQGAAIERYSAAEGVILRASSAISYDALASLVGKMVSVRGSFVDATPYKPKNLWEQYPMDMFGKPLPRGSGFVVASVEVIP